MLKILPDNGKLLFCRRLVFLDKRAVHLELRLSAGRADGNPGVVLNAVLEQVRPRQVCDALGEIEYLCGLGNEGGLLLAQGIHDGLNLLLARDALELVRGLRVVVVAVLCVELVQAVAERLALLLAAGGHLGDEQGRANGILVLRVGADEAAVALLIAEEEVMIRILLILSDLVADVLEARQRLDDLAAPGARNGRAEFARHDRLHDRRRRRQLRLVRLEQEVREQGAKLIARQQDVLVPLTHADADAVAVRIRADDDVRPDFRRELQAKRQRALLLRIR